jgi:alkylation response protein AidB-like acyl-CoA dehydrogenase
VTNIDDILDRVRTICAEVLAPAAAAVDEHHLQPDRGYQALAKAGVAGLLIPPSLGGQGAPIAVYAAAMEEISAACGSTSTVYMTQMHCAHPIHVAGTAQQQRRWIPGLCGGDAYGAIALTEPNVGSDIGSMEGVAVRDGDHYVVDAQKIFISNGDVADVIVLFVSTERSKGPRGITALLLEKGFAGFTCGRPMNKLGQRGASTVELSLSGCRIPVANRLGAEGAGYALLIQSVTTSRISAAAQGVGFARGAYEAAARFASAAGLLTASRRDAQDVQFALAVMRSRIQAARAMLAATAARIDRREVDTAADVSMTKLHCTAVGVEVAAEAVALLGPDGDRVDLGVERYLRDAKITEIYDGTSQVQSMIVARDIRGRFADS